VFAEGETQLAQILRNRTKRMGKMPMPREAHGQDVQAAQSA
jgi:hypothetical protein